MIVDILQNVNLFYDGKGLAGQIEEYTLPKIAVKLLEISAGGMAGVIDVPAGMLEKMETEFTINSVNPDIYDGVQFSMGQTVPLTARAVVQDDNGDKHAVIARMRGTVKEVDHGSWKAGEKASQKVSLSLRTYQLLRDGKEMIFADPMNMVLRVNGIDQLAADRAILGV
jgi:uncharacterized protein